MTDSAQGELAACIATAEARIRRLSLRLEEVIGQLDVLNRWGREMGQAAAQGHRLLAVGNGGSAAQVDHFVAELVGRFRRDRAPISAINVQSQTPTLTALANDLEFRQAAARAVRAHGRPGDILLCLSTSGASQNIIAAATEGQLMGVRSYAITGMTGCPLNEVVDCSLAFEGGDVASIQELHLVAIHVLCDAIEITITASVG
jgi:D-sedoheptulose 7-phosphate isomerase